MTLHIALFREHSQGAGIEEISGGGYERLALPLDQNTKLTVTWPPALADWGEIVEWGLFNKEGIHVFGKRLPFRTLIRKGESSVLSFNRNEIPQFPRPKVGLPWWERL